MAYKGELLTTYQLRWSSKYSKGRFNSCIDAKTLTPRFTPSWRSVSNGKKRNSFSRMMSIRMTKKGSQITTPLSAPGFSSHLTHPSLNKSQQRPKKNILFQHKTKMQAGPDDEGKNQSWFVCALSVNPKLKMLEKTYLSISRCCIYPNKYSKFSSGKDMGLETFGPNLHRYRCIRATYLLTWLICGLQIAWEKWLTGSSSCSWCA